VILEVLDEAGNPCRPGETGRVVITALHNYLTPFVRYEIMDSATVGPANCPCGRGLPLLTKIGGKLRPLFRLADGRRKSSVELLHAIRACGPHRQQQIIQREIDLVVVRIIPAPRWSDEHGRRIPEIAREFFEAPVRTEVELLDFLHLPPGGKLQEVVCELDRREASPRE
ncbi:MAG: hypothetical protein SFU86_13500, partial [Pirellulaceae bacterium]|nr:hypothetical protein [Pirellulaceae bacterium]